MEADDEEPLSADKEKADISEEEENIFLKKRMYQLRKELDTLKKKLLVQELEDWSDECDPLDECDIDFCIRNNLLRKFSVTAESLAWKEEAKKSKEKMEEEEKKRKEIEVERQNERKLELMRGREKKLMEIEKEKGKFGAEIQEIDEDDYIDYEGERYLEQLYIKSEEEKMKAYLFPKIKLVTEKEKEKVEEEKKSIEPEYEDEGEVYPSPEESEEDEEEVQFELPNELVAHEQFMVQIPYSPCIDNLDESATPRNYEVLFSCSVSEEYSRKYKYLDMEQQYINGSHWEEKIENISEVDILAEVKAIPGLAKVLRKAAKARKTEHTKKEETLQDTDTDSVSETEDTADITPEVTYTKEYYEYMEAKEA